MGADMIKRGLISRIGLVSPVIINSPLSFSPVGEMQVTPNLIKTGRCRLLQFCQRLGDAGHSESDKPLTIKQSNVSVPPLRGRLGGG